MTDIPICNICGKEKEWTYCFVCGGDGGLVYDGEYIVCSECDGSGYPVYECPSFEEHYWTSVLTDVEIIL